MIHTPISGVIGPGGTSRRVGARPALGRRLRSGAAASGSRMLAAHAWQTLVAAELVLRSVTGRANDAGVRNVEELRAIPGTASIHQLLRERQKGAPQVNVASTAERSGDVVNFTGGFPPRAHDGSRINLLEHGYFQAHLASPKLDPPVSKPVQNKGTGTWTFYLADGTNLARNRSGTYSLPLVVLVMVTIAMRRMLAKNDRAMHELVSAHRRAESASPAQSLMAVVQETVASVRAASRLAGAGQ